MSCPQTFATPSLPVLDLEVTTGSARPLRGASVSPQPNRRLRHQQRLDTTFPLSYFPP